MRLDTTVIHREIFHKMYLDKWLEILDPDSQLLHEMFIVWWRYYSSLIMVLQIRKELAVQETIIIIEQLVFVIH